MIRRFLLWLHRASAPNARREDRHTAPRDVNYGQKHQRSQARRR
jgi:hypothetical protein